MTKPDDVSTRPLFINSLSGPLTSGAIDLGWCVSRLKAWVEAETRIPAAEQELLLDTTVLLDDKCLGDVLPHEEYHELTLFRRSPAEEELLRMLGMDAQFQSAWKQVMSPGSEPGEARQKLLGIAVEIVKLLATAAADFRGTGHLEGFPSIRWQEEWGALTPNVFRASEDTDSCEAPDCRSGGTLLTIRKASLVASIHCMVIVRISEAAQSLLKDHGAGCVNDGVFSCWNDSGWRIGDIAFLRRSYPPGETFQIIAGALIREFPETFEVDRSLEVVSCTVNELVYQMTFRAVEEDSYGDGSAFVLGSV